MFFFHTISSAFTMKGTVIGMIFLTPSLSVELIKTFKNIISFFELRHSKTSLVYKWYNLYGHKQDRTNFHLHVKLAHLTVT